MTGCVCKRGAVSFYSWDLPVLVLAYIPPSGFRWELQQTKYRALQTPLGHSAAQQPTTACLNAKRVCWSSPVCPLPVHLQVHYICGSNPQSALGLWRVQGRGCGSTSVCGSACRPAADPQIIIAIKHCFPNKTISLPLILRQSLFLFTSGHSNPGAALTRGKTQARLKIGLCSVDEMEM